MVYAIAFESMPGMFKLVGDKKSETFEIKDHIKEAGGKWHISGDAKFWVIDKHNLHKLANYIVMPHQVRYKEYCHMSNGIDYATETEIQNKKALRVCSECGYSQWVDIEPIDMVKEIDDILNL